MSVRIYAPEGDCRAYEKLSTITAAKGFTATKLLYKGRIAQAVLITVEEAAIRFTIDGTTPVVTGTSEAGHLMNAGDSFIITGHESIRNFLCINAVAANGAEVFCSFYF